MFTAAAATADRRHGRSRVARLDDELRGTYRCRRDFVARHPRRVTRISPRIDRLPCFVARSSRPVATQLSRSRRLSRRFSHGTGVLVASRVVRRATRARMPGLTVVCNPLAHRAACRAARKRRRYHLSWRAPLLPPPPPPPPPLSHGWIHSRQFYRSLCSLRSTKSSLHLLFLP